MRTTIILKEVFPIFHVITFAVNDTAQIYSLFIVHTQSVSQQPM